MDAVRGDVDTGDERREGKEEDVGAVVTGFGGGILTEME